MGGEEGRGGEGGGVDDRGGGREEGYSSNSWTSGVMVVVWMLRQSREESWEREGEGEVEEGG